MLKIGYKILNYRTEKQRRRPVRKGYCRVCGAKLSDARSIEIGIGRHCLSENVAIVLEIIPDAASNTGLQADVAKADPITRDWSGKEEDKAWAYLQKPPRS